MITLCFGLFATPPTSCTATTAGMPKVVAQCGCAHCFKASLSRRDLQLASSLPIFSMLSPRPVYEYRLLLLSTDVVVRECGRSPLRSRKREANF